MAFFRRAASTAVGALRLISFMGGCVPESHRQSAGSTDEFCAGVSVNRLEVVRRHTVYSQVLDVTAVPKNVNLKSSSIVLRQACMWL